MSDSRTDCPGYYKPEDVVRRYMQRLNLVAGRAKDVGLTHFSWNKTKRILVGIDFQNDFVIPEIKGSQGEIIQPAGSLLVTGATDDLRRLIEFIYHYPEFFSSLLFTMDKHVPLQIFFPSWWRDCHGIQPAPFTRITYEQVKADDFIPKMQKTPPLPSLSKNCAENIFQNNSFASSLWLKANAHYKIHGSYKEDYYGRSFFYHYSLLVYSEQGGALNKARFAADESA